jgi:hypothetical protein
MHRNPPNPAPAGDAQADPRREASAVHEGRPGVTRSKREAMQADILACAALAAFEAVLVLMTVGHIVTLPLMLMLHCAVLVVMAFLLDRRERTRTDARLLSVALVATAICGPIGAVSSVLLGLLLLRRQRPSELIERWYQRIAGHMAEDPVRELHERIRSGRTLNPHIDATARFGAILRHGPLEQKQQVLGVIAQKYHPRFAGLLQLAMRNEEPPIRVQAAAVAARLRGDERQKLRSLLEEAARLAPAASQPRLELAQAMRDRIAFGLLDEQEEIAALEAARKICTELREKGTHAAAATLVLAELAMHSGDFAVAAELLEPQARSGADEALEPYRECLLRLRRFGDLAALSGGSTTARAAP